MILTFSSLICIGSIVFSIGVGAKSFSIMVLGRVLFGLGGESLEVAVTRITTDWFQGYSNANRILNDRVWIGNGVGVQSVIRKSRDCVE